MAACTAELAQAEPVSELLRSTDALWLAAAVAVLALVGGAALAWRALQSHQALVMAAQQARAEADALAELADVFTWRSDAEHRVVRVRSPRGLADDWALQDGVPPAWQHFTADDPAALRRLLESHAPVDDLPVRIARPGQPQRAGLLRARPCTDAQGRFAGHHGTLRALDAPPLAVGVPASRSSVAAAGTTAPEGDAANDYESFSFTVSHDLRAPIRVVEGFTKIVKEDYGRLLDRVGNDHLDRVLGAAARMNNMIDALLGLAKLSSQPLAHQPVNLTQLARFVADDLTRQWPERQVELDIAPDLQVQGDPTLLRVVLENLIGNAWKYTGKSPGAVISFGRHAQNADAFTVSDNGAGFDMRFADRLFGVFQRLHSANDFPGTGIGLASVRRIVRRHGGEIWGDGLVNGGARFHFSLPRGTSPH